MKINSVANTLLNVLMLLAGIAPLILFFVMRRSAVKKSDELNEPEKSKNIPEETDHAEESERK